MTLLELKHEAEQTYGIQRGTLARATRTTEYVRARTYFVKTALFLGYKQAEIDRFMGWVHGSAYHYAHK